MEILTNSNINAPSNAASEERARLLAQFLPISLQEASTLGMDRTDTKFVFHVHRLAHLLDALRYDYNVLEIRGARSSQYQTVYFDTPGFQFYLQHHAGKRNRMKIRSRRYLDTDQSFLEVKFKTNSNRTRKQRVETDSLITHYENRSAAWNALGPEVSAATLEAKLWNDFTRITLVNLQRRERVTIDVDLEFQSNHATAMFPRLVIVEVKQPRLDRRSVVMRTLEGRGLYPMSFSKYCIGVATLYPHIKHNNFKPTLQYLEKLDPTANYAH